MLFYCFSVAFVFALRFALPLLRVLCYFVLSLALILMSVLLYVCLVIALLHVAFDFT